MIHFENDDGVFSILCISFRLIRILSYVKIVPKPKRLQMLNGTSNRFFVSTPLIIHDPHANPPQLKVPHVVLYRFITIQANVTLPQIVTACNIILVQKEKKYLIS